MNTITMLWMALTQQTHTTMALFHTFSWNWEKHLFKKYIEIKQDFFKLVTSIKAHNGSHVMGIFF